MDCRISLFEKHNDKRGDLVVFLKNLDLKKGKTKFGQIYFVTFNKKGIVRGNHYHKKWREWFGIVEGKVQILLEDIRTNEKKTFILNSKGRKYQRLEVGPYVAHTIRSIASYSSIINYADDIWSKKDTYYYKLL